MSIGSTPWLHKNSVAVTKNYYAIKSLTFWGHIKPHFFQCNSSFWFHFFCIRCVVIDYLFNYITKTTPRQAVQQIISYFGIYTKTEEKQYKNCSFGFSIPDQGNTFLYIIHPKKTSRIQVPKQCKQYAHKSSLRNKIVILFRVYHFFYERSIVFTSKIQKNLFSHTALLLRSLKYIQEI